MIFLAGGELLVVETEDDQFLGTAAVDGDSLVIRPGYVGRPVRVPLTDVIRVTLAAEHDDIEHDDA
jgi:hypothetical protein